MQTNGNFYLGRIYDLVERETTTQALLYDPDDLTTHAVVVGMTGSGKTGLCIDLLEEAALNDTPSIMIDPKGDITNALLHFPDLLPSDFQPWVNPDEARKEGKTIEQAGVEAAALWRNGLSKWGIGPERIQTLKDSAHFAIYTPGSDAGIPISILASLKAPQVAWEGNQEILREKISGTVTALLSLVGLDNLDPVQSREHILLANIFEHAWKRGMDLDLSELILQTQSPPFEKLGVFEIDMFFPDKDRFGLAMLLNNILAAPAFQTWIQGQPLDIPTLLYGPDGKPRHSIFYIAHLTDTERMFIVTLLYSAIESWMRSQTGTPSLRAIIYFDEIFGYLPPIGNPPSKQIMLRMLKQARAFGVGQMLVTQNPVDLDYKALSNAGTWFIGKLQTEQDKERLLDGLEGALSEALNRRQYDKMISGLDKRVFLLHNVHEKEPVQFYTRWAMNYLAGPLTRAQIPALNLLAGAIKIITDVGEGPKLQTTELITQESSSITVDKSHLKAESAKPEEILEQLGSLTRPAIPSQVAEYFIPNNLTVTQALKNADISLPGDLQNIGQIYRPVLISQSNIRFLDRKYKIDHEQQVTAIVSNPDRRGRISWGNYTTNPINDRDMDQDSNPQARFSFLEAPFTDKSLMSAIKKDFLDWVYHESELNVQANETLKLYAGPETSTAEFRKLCSDAARQMRDDEIRELSLKYRKKMDMIETRLKSEERELEKDRDEHSQRKMEELGSHAETVLSMFGGRRRSISTSLSKRRMTQKAKAEVDESLDAIENYKLDIAELEKELAQQISEINDRWGEIANQISEIPIKPYKKDIILDLFGVAWMPYHVVQIEGEIREFPGYQAT